jgi:hypothetical protein
MRFLLAFASALVFAGGAWASPLTSRDELLRAAAADRSECEANHFSACRALGLLAESRPSLNIPYGQQVALFAKACKGGSADGCVDWGRTLRFGPREDRDLDRVGKLWSEACTAGSAWGCRWAASAIANAELEAPGSSKSWKLVRLQAAFDALFIQVTRARTLARPLLGDHELADVARLILTCADIIEEHWDEARTRVEGRGDADPAYKVLAALIDVRTRNPDEAWSESYVRAWALAGRPDMRKSALTPFSQPPPHRPVEATNGSALGRLLLECQRWDPFATSPPEPLPGSFVQEAIDLAQGDDTALRVLALTIVRAPGVPESMRARAHDAAVAIARSLAKANEGNLATALLSFETEASQSAAFGEADVVAMETLAKAPRYDSLYPQVFEMDWAALGSGDVNDALALAVTAANEAAFPGASQWLLTRANASRDRLSPQLWSRLVAALHAIGEKMHDAGTLLEMAMGNSLLALDGEATPESKAAVEERRNLFVTAQESWQPAAADGLWLLPIPVLREATIIARSAEEVDFPAALDAVLAEATAK